MNDERLKELWTCRLEEQPLSADQSQELMDALATDESRRTECLEDEALHGLMRVFAYDEGDGAAFVQQFKDRLRAEEDGSRFVARFRKRLSEEPSRTGLRARLKTWTLAVAAMLVIAVTVGILLRGTNGPLPEIRAVNGDVKILRNSKTLIVTAGDQLISTDTLAVATGGNAQVGYVGERTTLVFDANTQAKLWDENGAKRVQLISGLVTADVDSQPSGRPLVLLTPHLRVEVVGTRFTLDVDKAGSRIEMEHGRVKVQRTSDGQALELAAGQFAEAGPSMSFTAQAIAVSGSAEFQEGVNGFASTKDVSFSTQGINPNGVVLRGNDLGVWRQVTTTRDRYETRALIKFEGISIPKGSKVTSARLTLAVDIWEAPWQILGYYVKQAWNPTPESGLGWLYRDQGKTWSEPGGKGEGTDVVASNHFTLDGNMGMGTTPHSVDLDPAIVQTWLNDPAANQGVLVINPMPDKAIRIKSSRSQTVALRPKLTISWSRKADPQGARP